MKFKPEDKVWIHENDVLFPGIVLGSNDNGIVVCKFDQVIWRSITVPEETLSKRTRSFADFMFEVRQNFITVPIKFMLP